MSRATEDKAQQFDRLVAVYKRVPTTDSQGTKDYGYALYKRLWMKKLPIRGTVRSGEQFAAGQVHAQYTCVFRTRYRTDLDSTMRLICLGEKFDVCNPPIDIEGNHTVTELQCVNGVGDGRTRESDG